MRFWNWPAGQEKATVIPGSGTYLPSGASKQPVDPAEGWYLPRGHAAHVVAPPLAKRPAGHWYSPAAAENGVMDPVVTAVHVEAPVDAAYWPVGHAEHAVAVVVTDPVAWPRGHTERPATPLNGFQYPSPTSTQDVRVPSSIRPAGHAVQLDALPAETKPGLHWIVASGTA